MTYDVVVKLPLGSWERRSSALLVSCSAATSGTPDGRGDRRSLRPRRTATSSKPTAPTRPRKAVTAAGGQVVSRLGVIDAVEATLTDAQHASVLAVARRQADHRPMRTVTTQAAASVRDNFETGSFANNDGTHRWYGDWVEQNDNNSPYDGKVTIGWNERGGKRLIVGGNGAIYRRAATPASSPSGDAQVQVARAPASRPANTCRCRPAAMAAPPGPKSVASPAPANDTASPRKSYNITAYRGRNTAIRFVGSMSGTFPGDYVDIDDVEITYTTTFGEGDPFPVDVNAQDLHMRRHSRPRHRRRGHRHRLLETQLARQGFAGNGRVAVQYDAVRNAVDSQLVVRLHRHQRSRHAHHQPHRQQPQEQRPATSSASRPTRASFRSRRSAKTVSSSYATVIRGIDWVVTNRTPVRHSSSESCR